jgi:protein-tyrosine phosphatase
MPDCRLPLVCMGNICRSPMALRRLTEFCQHHDSPVVPDPYYGGAGGFDAVLDLVEDACDDLLQHVQRQLR